jgi:hypothetical protein
MQIYHMINICLKKHGQLPQLWFRFFLAFQMLSQESLLITFLGNDRTLRHKQVYMYICPEFNVTPD